MAPKDNGIELTRHSFVAALPWLGITLVMPALVAMLLLNPQPAQAVPAQSYSDLENRRGSLKAQGGHFTRLENRSSQVDIRPERFPLMPVTTPVWHLYLRVH